MEERSLSKACLESSHVAVLQSFAIPGWLQGVCTRKQGFSFKTSLICAKRTHPNPTSSVTPSVVQSSQYSNHCQNGEHGHAAVPISGLQLALVISTCNHWNDTFTLNWSGPLQVIIVDVWIYFPFTETQREYKATYEAFCAQSINLDTSNTQTLNDKNVKLC